VQPGQLASGVGVRLVPGEQSLGLLRQIADAHATLDRLASEFATSLFAQWAPALVDAAGVQPGHSVLDVACGTGILARIAADRVGPSGTVSGVDLNQGMLTVARRLRPDLDWRQGDVADLPFADGSFDVVACQSALMFFPDATGALREMGRVCRPAGTVAVQVYRSLDDQPAYGPWVELVAARRPRGEQPARHVLGARRP
jgi:ubiquinone/menaquinone biosynthesis C-methylase UbiE